MTKTAVPNRFAEKARQAKAEKIVAYMAERGISFDEIGDARDKLAVAVGVNKPSEETWKIVESLTQAPKPSKAWRAPKVRRTRDQVCQFIDVIDIALSGIGLVEEQSYWFGGSVRRQSPTVGDIDVIVLASDIKPIIAALEKVGYKVEKGADLAAQGDLTLWNGQMIHLDVWLVAQPEQLGAFLCYVTGPKDLNVAQRNRALKLGWHFKQQGLLDDAGAQYDDGTEKGCYAALGWKWIEPEDRDRWRELS